MQSMVEVTHLQCGMHEGISTDDILSGKLHIQSVNCKYTPTNCEI